MCVFIVNGHKFEGTLSNRFADITIIQLHYMHHYDRHYIYSYRITAVNVRRDLTENGFSTAKFAIFNIPFTI